MAALAGSLGSALMASLDQGLASVVACRKDRPVASASVLDLALEVPMLARLLRADFVAVAAAKIDLPLGC